jgi:glycosyltransferase involved in cell wall biosynthesis
LVLDLTELSIARHMPQRKRPRTLLITVSKSSDEPWWWKELDHDALACQLVHEPIVVPGGRPRSLRSLAFWSMLVSCTGALFRSWWRGDRYVLTFECSWQSFIVSGIQTLLFMRRPRHVILQFIMRERTPSLRSAIKYAFMKWCFSSVYLNVCSSRPEVVYYARVFGWPLSRFGYVPLHTDPGLLQHPERKAESYVFSAGRTFRDYATLLASFEGITNKPLVIVAARGSVDANGLSHVRVVYEVPVQELVDMMARSEIVVLPLEEREISIGQSVLMQAMALGKPVIVTRVNGTVDYVEHMRTGVLVPPRDAAAIRDAVRLLSSDQALRARLGASAREQMVRAHLPTHYAASVAELLHQKESGT